MDGKLLNKLKEWRRKEADRRGTETYRVLQNSAIEGIAETKPSTKEELLEVKGIADKKWNRYGRQILDIVADSHPTSNSSPQAGEEDREPVPVSEYLNRVNRTLAELEASVRGEVTQIQEKYGNYYMTLTDPEDESSMDVYMKGRDYELAGIEVKEGMEVVVTGFPSVYKKYGRFSLRATAVELVGEGALKKAYEKLKKKLTEEGLFEDERKKEIPQFAQKVGLITSSGSDAYHDLAANLGKYGFEIQFYPSRVQGGRAVKELLQAFEYFKDSDVDVVVVTRGGGGDLEVLQAFNNEKVVRTVAGMDIPVIAGIGHEKDVPLTSLAADVMVSTPTGSAEILNRSWQKLENYLSRYAQRLPALYKEVLREKEHELEGLSQKIERRFTTLFERVDVLEQKMTRALDALGHAIVRQKEEFERRADELVKQFERDLETVRTSFKTAAKRLEDADPRKALERGYSIVRTKDGVVKGVGDVSTGEEIDIRVSDGTIESEVTDIHTSNSNNSEENG